MENVFNHFYQDYDAWYETASGRFVDRVETDALLGLLNPRPGMEVLEVGCGTGNYLLKLAGAGCRITGIDIAPHMLEQARAKLTRHGISAALSIMNGKSLSFTDGIFDAAYSMAAFEFIDDIETVYREMRRVVRPGGDIVIGTIQRGSSWSNSIAVTPAKVRPSNMPPFGLRMKSPRSIPVTVRASQSASSLRPDSRMRNTGRRQSNNTALKAKREDLYA